MCKYIAYLPNKYATVAKLNYKKLIDEEGVQEEREITIRKTKKSINVLNNILTIMKKK